MSTRNESTCPVAVLRLPKQNRHLLAFAKAVYEALRNNPSFPNPSPSLDVFEKDIAAFDEAETKAASRARGAAAFRDAKKKKVTEDLDHLRDYVQSIVEADIDPTTGAALIQSAFMSVKKAYKRSTPEIQAKNADVSGKVALAAKAMATPAVYSWEYSLDQSTWTPMLDTMRARAEVSGLTSASIYYFRFRTFTRAGRGDYSQVVSLLVH